MKENLTDSMQRYSKDISHIIGHILNFHSHTALHSHLYYPITSN